MVFGPVITGIGIISGYKECIIYIVQLTGHLLISMYKE